MRSFNPPAAAIAMLLMAAGSPADDGKLPPGPKTDIALIDTADLPPGLLPVIEAAMPGMQIAETERKERDGRVYFDVEGTRTDGSEVEIDLLVEGDGYRVVEIQRDVGWSTVEPATLAAATAAGLDFEPARVIESRQVEDDSLVYELFEPGKPHEPAMEIRFKDGRAEALSERSPH